MIVPMTIDHALFVSRNMREVDFAEVMATRWDDDVDNFALESFRLPGIAYTAINDKNGLPVCIGGVAFHSPQVGTAWMVATDDFLSVALSVTRHVRRVIKTLLASELQRIHAFSADFHTDAHRWMQRCGMQCERTVPALGKNGEDFIVFSILRGDS